jgi:hypothetical protein
MTKKVKTVSPERKSKVASMESHSTDPEDPSQQFSVNEPEDAWLEYCMTRDRTKLAKYLKLRGEVTEEVRDELVEVLNGAKKGLVGGANPFRDWMTYNYVHNMHTRKNFPQLNRTRRVLETPTPVSKHSIMQDLAIEQSVDVRTIEERYRKGKKLNEAFSASTKN